MGSNFEGSGRDSLCSIDFSLLKCFVFYLSVLKILVNKGTGSHFSDQTFYLVWRHVAILDLVSNPSL